MIVYNNWLYYSINIIICIDAMIKFKVIEYLDYIFNIS